MFRNSSAFIAGVLVALVVGTGTAYAATGGTFILGRSNSAGTTTTLTNANGSALALNSKSGQPSLRVNRTTKVPNLNADRLDGLDQSAFARVGKLGSITESGFVDDGGTPADATDDVVMAVAVCPTGSQVTGGGGTDLTEDGIVFASFPDTDPDTGTTAWVVMSTTSTLTDANAQDVAADARCYNPRANVASNARLAPPSYELSAAARKIAAGAAAKN